MKDIEALIKLDSWIFQANERIKVQRDMGRAFPGILEHRRARRVYILNKSIERLKQRRKTIIIKLYKQYVTETKWD